MESKKETDRNVGDHIPTHLVLLLYTIWPIWKIKLGLEIATPTSERLLSWKRTYLGTNPLAIGNTSACHYCISRYGTSAQLVVNSWKLKDGVNDTKNVSWIGRKSTLDLCKPLKDHTTSYGAHKGYAWLYDRKSCAGPLVMSLRKSSYRTANPEGYVIKRRPCCSHRPLQILWIGDYKMRL